MKREWMGAARLGVVLFLLYLAIHYWGALSSLLLLGLGAAFPLVLGAVIAYAVNILMSLYEGWYFPDTKSAGLPAFGFCQSDRHRFPPHPHDSS